MHLTTTFWSEDVHVFHELLFVRGHKQDFTVMDRTALGCASDVSRFFRRLAAFVGTRQAREHRRRDDLWYQFAVMQGEELMPVKWFDLVLSNGVVLSHDIAFNTTLVRRNDMPVPLGRFPRGSRRLPRYRELKLKRRVYKYIANQALADTSARPVATEGAPCK